MTTLFSNVSMKLSAISSLITRNKLENIEKELIFIKNKIKKELDIQKKEFEMVYKTSSSQLQELINKWKYEIDIIEKKLQKSILNVENEYNKARTPQLLKKIDLFINQTINALNALLDAFRDEAMNQLQLHFNQPNHTFLQTLNIQKERIIEELKNRENHVQLVFTRYKDFPIDEMKKKWNLQYMQLQNRLNEIKTKIFNFLELKKDITKALDCYYEMAKPAYGYKVPIKIISEKIGMPEAKLENLFVDLISDNFISGEIDPVTKVIVLAPRVSPEQKVIKKVAGVRCMVCNLIISPSKDEIIYCPHCSSPAHRTHLIEWIKIKGFCPNCKREIKMI